ncbi:hypothetical protein D9615_000429 [Tricholomella constricta]|uniref:Lon N-terminal domain-containing protein n=1 Tax=Tricholomella constricta TaxID=117010 RepID=A0A8H5HRG7_9AGAR|nr:hypothetical protein D9615_000429 [Tricholomella constricta]
MANDDSEHTTATPDDANSRHTTPDDARDWPAASTAAVACADALATAGCNDPGPPSTPGPSNTPTAVANLLMPDSVLRLLACPLCRKTLSAPTTLHCGHSLCNAHLLSNSLSCPVPLCAQLRPSSPNIPSSSSVAYYPAPLDSAAPDPPPSSLKAIDVTLSKIIFLLNRLQGELDRAEDHSLAPHLSDDSDSSDDDDDDAIASSSARTRPRSRSADSTTRPRKRPRHHSPDGDDDDGDLLAHLCTQSARQRSTRHDQPLLPSDPPSTTANPDPDPLLARFEKDLLTELTCEICFTLLYEPITTPYFLLKELPGFLYFQEHPPNKIILSLLLEVFPTPYRERGEAIEAEERDARLDTPIFICQLSFPGMPTLLHFFEPRYRLMLRRCLESPNPSFGMVMPPKPGGLTPQMEYGTMLEIRSVQMQADGRSLVETWGSYRFRILESGTLDGYVVGRIERIDDFPEDLTEDPGMGPVAPLPSPSATTALTTSASSTSSPPQSSTSGSTSSLRAPTRPPSLPTPLQRHPSNSALMTQCRTFLDQLERGTAPWIVQRLASTYGLMPTDVSSFSFWVASILPIDDHEKAKLLPIRSPRLRLLLVVHWIEQLNNNWYTVFLSFFRLVKTALLLIGLFFFWPMLRVSFGGIVRWFSSGCGIL